MTLIATTTTTTTRATATRPRTTTTTARPLSAYERHAAAARRLGVYLRQRRGQLGLTLGAVGARAGMSAPALSRYESGHDWPQAKNMHRIAAGYQTTVGKLYAVAGENTRTDGKAARS